MSKTHPQGGTNRSARNQAGGAARADHSRIRLPRDPERIVVRCVNWLGDAVMTTPALSRLRERFPGAAVTLVAREKLAGLWQGEPGIAGVVALGNREGVLAAAGRIRELRADLALIFPNSTRGALEARLAGVPVRVGFANGARFLLLTHPVARPSGHSAMRKRSKADIMALLRSGVARKKYPAAAHQAHDYLALVAALGGNPAPVAPSIHVTRQELQAAVGRFGLAGDFPGALPLIGLNAGAEYGPAKRWPAERFVAAATQTHSRVPCAWVIFGSQADQPLAARIEAALKSARLPVLDLAGRTSLRELCALLKLCKTVLTNDTGPMHLAAAVGTPVVVPFGSTSPELTGPGLPGSAGHALLVPDVPCAPCFLRECPIDLRCLKQVTPGQASAALLHTLRAAR